MARASVLVLVAGLPALVFAQSGVVSNPNLDSGRSQYGGVGLSRVQSASILPRSISVSAHGGLLQESYLTKAYGVDLYRMLVVGAAVAPAPWLELAVTSRSSTHDQTVSSPVRLTRLNELFLSAKTGMTAADGSLALAMEGGVRVPPPMGPWGQLAGVSPHLGALASYSRSPFRLHLNAGFTVDNTRQLDSSPPDESRRFALDISAYNQLSLGLGAEGMWRVSSLELRPFVESTLDFPLGGQGVPARLTPGLRLMFWRGLSVSGAVELGVSRPQVSGVPAVPAYMGLLSVGYQARFDPERELVERTIEKERLVEIERAATYGVIRGLVHDAATAKPIADSIVTVAAKPRLLSGEDGKFEMVEVSPGKVKVRAERSGYERGEEEVTVTAGKEIQVEIALRALPPPPPPPATLKGTIVSASDKQLSSAEVSVPTANIAPRPFSKGEYQLEVPSGELSVEASAPGHLKKGRRIVAQPGEIIVADFVLEEIPKKSLVVLRKEKIEIKKQVHFATNRDVILPDSAQLLDEVAATILENPQLPEIRIEGHTDSQGDDAYNKELSERRARSVMRALLDRGVASSRLSAVGLGETMPISSNKTSSGRAQNRRVEFMIER